MNTKPCGLANLGNTCFLNACVQALLSIDEFQETNVSTMSPDKIETIVLREWQQMWGAMHSNESFNKVLVPKPFVQAIHAVAMKKDRILFTGFAQNDMPEFLLFFIECLHESISRKANLHIQGTAENEVDHLARDCYSMLQTSYARGDYSEFMDIFYGIYVSKITSLVGVSKSSKPEPFFILDLPLSSDPRQTMESCFDRYVEKERLERENAWWNEETKAKEDVYKHTLFWKFPPILVVVFQRFLANGQQKNNALVEFPLENLDLSKYVVGYNAKQYVYDLFAICNHMGGIAGGHYTAFAKRACADKTAAWFHFNDTHVEAQTDLSAMVSPAAYCLFYRKKNKPV